MELKLTNLNREIVRTIKIHLMELLNFFFGKMWTLSLRTNPLCCFSRRCCNCLQTKKSISFSLLIKMNQTKFFYIDKINILKMNIKKNYFKILCPFWFTTLDYSKHCVIYIFLLGIDWNKNYISEKIIYFSILFNKFCQKLRWVEYAKTIKYPLKRHLTFLSQNCFFLPQYY